MTLYTHFRFTFDYIQISYSPLRSSEGSSSPTFFDGGGRGMRVEEKKEEREGKKGGCCGGANRSIKANPTAPPREQKRSGDEVLFFLK